MDWLRTHTDPRETGALARALRVSPILATLLLRRGLGAPDQAQAFLEPSLRDLPNPSLLPDLDRAVDRLIQALNLEERIVVYGDYDADGLTATALLADFLRSLGARVSTYIPHRVTEGYGLNPEAVKHLAQTGHRLLVTVDCGVADFEMVALARECGLDVIVTDHHQPPHRLPPALAVVNPKRPDSAFPQREIAGVGVAFFLAGGLRQALRERGVFSQASQPELAPLLGLVALGTVADVAPLTQVNRILVTEGLHRLADPDRPGLTALKESCALASGRPPTSSEVAFQLAPRLNAAGRIDSPQPGLDLLLTRNADDARVHAGALERVNRERKRLQEQMIREALALLEDKGERLGRTIVLANEGWHRGLVGLAASKLAEQYGRPTLLLSIEDGTAHGSGRSIPGFNLFAALDRCRDLLVRFGGHDQAAGLSLDLSQLPRLIQAFEDIASHEIRDDDLRPRLPIEAEVTLADLNRGLAHEIDRLAPFGEGNPEPILAVTDLKPLSSSVVGGKHLRLRLGDNGQTLDTIGFNLGAMLTELGRQVSVAVQPHTSTYNGRTTLGWKVVDIKKGRD